MATPGMNGPPIPKVPLLEPGDRLTSDEFERRYDAMPALKKAELLEGVVFMPSPVRWARHAGPHADLITWLGVYRAQTPGVRAGDNGTLRLDTENQPQPDGVLLVEPSHGGRVQLSSDDRINPPQATGALAPVVRWVSSAALAVLPTLIFLLMDGTLSTWNINAMNTEFI